MLIDGLTSCSPSDKIQICSSSSSENFHFSNVQHDKEFKNVLETVMWHGPEVEQDLTFVSLFREVTSENGIDELILLSKDDLSLLHHQSECLSPELSDLEITDIQSLQFYLKKS